MRNLLIVLLAAALVIAGAFLPQMLLNRQQVPELRSEYQLVNVTSEDSSDYAWKMRMLGDHYYADREDLMSTYISGAFSEQETKELRGKFEKELAELVRKKVISTDLLDAVLGEETSTINCFYIFDTGSLAGFRIAVMTVGGKGWQATVTLELESGKIGRIETVIETWRKLPVRPEAVYSWYDTLRGYGDYLGLSQSAFSLPEQVESTEHLEKITQDRLTAQFPDSAEWLQIRAMQYGITTTLCVYSGGEAGA